VGAGHIHPLSVDAIVQYLELWAAVREVMLRTRLLPVEVDV
jgi:hypothetical protein